jgi:hypothetical protein
MKISFIASNEEIFYDFPYPEPSHKFVPQWYKDMPFFTTDEKYIGSNGNPNLTIKKCVPFRDTLFSGYMIPLPYDVYISQNNNGITNINKSYCGEFEIIHKHDISQYFMYPIPDEYNPVILKWNNPWIIKTKKGWSILFMSPMHHDLPFTTFSGIVDTDKHPISISFPFLIRKDFNGILKKGTPIVQCIPIKRENFMAYVSSNIPSMFHKWRKATTQVMDRYKDYFHTPKQYKIVNKQTESKCPFSKIFK